MGAYSQNGRLSEEFLGFFNRLLWRGRCIQRLSAAEISQSAGVLAWQGCMLLPGQVWVHAEQKSHRELQGTFPPLFFFLFRFHHVAVSSQRGKRARRDLSTSVRKCTLKRKTNGSLSLAGESGSCSFASRWVHLFSAGQQTHARTHTAPTTPRH